VCDELKKLLLPPDKRILFVGVGNVLKNDDGVGVRISRDIKSTPYVSALTVETSIENYIGKINSLRPDILVLVDCMDFGEPPGKSRLIKVEEVNDTTFNTHNISLKRLSEFFPMPVYVLGIQPESVEFGENISYLVECVADKIVKFINKEEVHHGN